MIAPAGTLTGCAMAAALLASPLALFSQDAWLTGALIIGIPLYLFAIFTSD